MTKIKMPPMQLLTSFCAAKPMARSETMPTAKSPDMFHAERRGGSNTLSGCTPTVIALSMSADLAGRPS